MLAINTGKGVKPEVNIRECIYHAHLHHRANNAAHFGFEAWRRHHQKFKTGYHWPQNGHVSIIYLCEFMGSVKIGVAGFRKQVVNIEMIV